MRNSSRQMLAAIALTLVSVSAAAAQGSAKDAMAMEKGITIDKVLLPS